MLFQRDMTQVSQEAEKHNGIIYLECTDSTNAEAKRLAEADAPHGTIVVADAQTAGRGRKGREWISPAGKNLYFSLLLRENILPEKASMLTLVMGLSVQEAVFGHCGVRTCIKWPNDIVFGDKKVAGILTEMHFGEGNRPYVIIGTGINVKAQVFVPELSDKATYLESAVEEAISREELLEAITVRFFENYDLFLKTMDMSLLLDAYQQALVNRDREVQVLEPEGAYTGVAEGINKEGELLVRLPDGRIANIYAGEVSVRGIYGYV